MEFTQTLNHYGQLSIQKVFTKHVYKDAFQTCHEQLLQSKRRGLYFICISDLSMLFVWKISVVRESILSPVSANR